MKDKDLYERYLKRLFDFLVALMAFILLSPIILFIYFIVMFTIGRPAIFKQARPGKNEKLFKLYKFRTMTDQKDEQGNLLPDDQRLTRTGKVLRATSLDELPSLMNVMLGHMSLVGPRPLLVEYLPLYNHTQRQRHLVRPGLTGLAQVKGRNAITWEEKFAYDVEYANHVSFWKDIKIMFKTISIVLKREGISSEHSVTSEKFKGN